MSHGLDGINPGAAVRHFNTTNLSVSVTVFNIALQNNFGNLLISSCRAHVEPLSARGNKATPKYHETISVFDRREHEYVL